MVSVSQGEEITMAARHQLPIITTAALHKQRHPPPRLSTRTSRLLTYPLPSKSSIITAAASSSTTTSGGGTWRLKLTYLEINSWVWELQQQGADDVGPPLRILVDPILVGDLDFGAPWLFNGAKKDPKVKALGVDGLTMPDLLLITQSLDDHCHVRTLKQLSARAPDLPVVTTPNARPVLASLPTPFRRVTYLEPGQSTAAGDRIRILATAGPVLGPPWQRPENGYIITVTGDDEAGGLLYYEPHCVYDSSFLERRRLRAEVVITPVVKQLLPANFTLVSGQEDAVELTRLLQASYVVPMSNGDVDATGLLATVLATEGTKHSFKAMLSEVLPEAQVLDAVPGVPLQLQLDMPLLRQPQQAAAT